MENQKKKEINAYNDIYLNPTPERKVDQKRVELTADFIIPKLKGDRILELGVGDQVYTPKLVEMFKEVVTIDASYELLNEMKKKLADKPWTPIVTLFEEFKPDKKFDVVLATNVLEHVDNPSLILELAYKKWLNEGGVLVVVVPHALSLHRRLGVKMGLASYLGELSDADKRNGHKWCFSCFDMEKMLSKAGFEIVEKKGMFSTLFPNSMLMQCNNDQLRGMFELGLELPIEYSAVFYFMGVVKSL